MEKLRPLFNRLKKAHEFYCKHEGKKLADEIIKRSENLISELESNGVPRVMSLSMIIFGWEAIKNMTTRELKTLREAEVKGENYFLLDTQSTGESAK